MLYPLYAWIKSSSNALVLLTVNFNPTNTWFQAKYITHMHHPKELVAVKTRDSGTVDWFLTNKPKLFRVSQLPMVGSSDHYTILAKPVSAPTLKPIINKTMTRSARYAGHCVACIGGGGSLKTTGPRFWVFPRLRTEISAVHVRYLSSHRNVSCAESFQEAPIRPSLDY